jgi:SET domain-containing protein
MSNISYISPKAAVKNSAIEGRGLFAVEPIARGEIVCIKGGYIFDRQSLIQVQTALGPAEIQVAEDFFIGPRKQEERDGGMIFSNHSCAPNIGVRGQIVLVALRDIDAGEELTHDWAMTDDDDYEMECKCGSADCRKIITGKDWMRKDLQEKYRDSMSWFLLEKIKRNG